MPRSEHVKPGKDDDARRAVRYSRTERMAGTDRHGLEHTDQCPGPYNRIIRQTSSLGGASRAGSPWPRHAVHPGGGSSRLCLLTAAVLLRRIRSGDTGTAFQIRPDVPGRSKDSRAWESHLRSAYRCPRGCTGSSGATRNVGGQFSRELCVPFSIVLSNLAPVLLMPLFNKFEPLRDRGMAKRITDLAAGQGVRVSEVLQMDMSKQTKKANAMFTGVGNTKRIILADTLLDEFTADEVEVVLAHELGHQVHRDLWKLIGLQVPVTLVTFFAAHRLTRPIMDRFGEKWGLKVEDGAADVAALPLLSLVGGAAGMVVGPALNAIIRRWIEHPADVYALDLTRKRGAFISAMEKLGKMNLSNPRPSLLVKWLLYDHPTLQERIDFGKKYTPR